MNYQGKERGKTRRTKPNQTKTVLIGKIYANWCPHCMTLKPEWSKMKKSIRNKLGKMNNIKVQFVEIEQGQEEDKVGRINRVYLRNSDKKLALQSGYPTLFRISGGQVDYFEGGRNAQEMEAFYLKENGNQLGDKNQMGGEEQMGDKNQMGDKQEPLSNEGGGIFDFFKGNTTTQPAPPKQVAPGPQQVETKKSMFSFELPNFLKTNTNSINKPKEGNSNWFSNIFSSSSTKKTQPPEEPQPLPNNKVGGKRKKHKNKTRKQKKT